MADLLASSIAVLASSIGLVLGFHKDLEVLQGYAEDIQAVLADAETKRSQNAVVLRWLKKVEGVAREASYVLDELLYESLRRQVKSRNNSKGGKVCLFFSLSKHDISFRLRMCSKVRDINAKLKIFNLEATSGVGLIRAVDSLVSANAAVTAVHEAKSRQTDSLALKFVAGRTSEVLDIVERLLMHSSDELVSVLSIIGMGGLGKTTVVKSVYNDVKINGHFGKKSWFCVSEKFDVTETFRGILESLKGVRVEPCGRDALVQQIQRELNRERFLFVLDDMWNEDKPQWDDFYNSLVAINTASGSCCVVTTRLQTTANITSTISPFVLGKLSDDDCWSILSQKATRGGDIPEELKVHKNQILKRCQGLPLAANAIGGLLSLQNRDNWISIVEKQVLKVDEAAIGEITPILKLSFDNLPSPFIKKCFAYCSIYEKDAEMDGKELVKLWMAEGFLRDDVERRKTMEEAGEKYLTILLQSSLLEKTMRWGKYYQMHDLVHDLMESISKQELFDVENNYHVQHLRWENIDMHWNARSPMVRILKGYSFAEMLLNIKFVHVLNLIGVTSNLNDAEKIEKLGLSISKLKHLRYLTIKVMPESLCKLYSLQTLRLVSVLAKHLPQGLSNLISLRHLLLDHSDEETQMPPEMGRLTCLRTLEFFNVGKEPGCGIEELGFLNNLEGKLSISNLQLVKDKEGAKLAKLCGKKNLEELELSWHRDSDNDADEHVLEGLEPHLNLRELSIRHYGGVRFPLWWKKLSVLVSLELNNCTNCTTLPALGGWPHLEILKISNCDNVVYIGESYYNVQDCRDGIVFPSLKLLRLGSMRNLVEWKELQVEAMNDFDHCGQPAPAPIYFPSLITLKIAGDVKVSMVKDIIGKSCSLLKHLTLRSMKRMCSVSDVITNHLNLTSLKRLKVQYCQELIDMPLSTLVGCTSLSTLKLESCPKLVSCPLDFKHTPSLKIIWFKGCPNMFTIDAMPRGFNHLTELRFLWIDPLTDDSAQLFDQSGWSGSSVLKSLNLKGSTYEHSSLPQQLQHFSSLVDLRLENFGSVEGLPDWFGSLKSLRALDLRKLPQLQYLPSASAMASLTNLQTLWISECPLLKESWDRKGNDPCSEWSKISCLPNLRVFIF